MSFLATESKPLKILLSFAVGGLLGDVFLNLLPQAWSYTPPEPSFSEHYNIVEILENELNKN